MENQSEDQGNGQVTGSSPQVAAGESKKPDGAMVFLSYFGIFALIPYLTVKDSDFIRWHAKQGLTLAAASVALMVLTMIIAIIPLIGLIAFLMPFVQLGILVIDIVAMVKAFDGQRWRIPVIADIAEKW